MSLLDISRGERLSVQVRAQSLANKFGKVMHLISGGGQRQQKDEDRLRNCSFGTLDLPQPVIADNQCSVESSWLPRAHAIGQMSPADFGTGHSPLVPVAMHVARHTHSHLPLSPGWALPDVHEPMAPRLAGFNSRPIPNTVGEEKKVGPLASKPWLILFTRLVEALVHPRPA